MLKRAAKQIQHFFSIARAFAEELVWIVKEQPDDYDPRSSDAQCWICPLCKDDKHHEPGDDRCKAAIDRTHQRLAEVERELAEALRRERELTAMTGRLREAHSSDIPTDRRRHGPLLGTLERVDVLWAAPWIDFAGETIHEGDTIQHPSGESGTVVFHPGREDVSDQWMVDYGDGISSRLILQVGEKGRAVCVRKGD